MTTRVGHEQKLYYNTGTNASPTWVLVKRAIDVSVPFAKGRADVSRRESKWKKERGAQIELGLEFGYLYRTGTDTVWAALLDSALNGTPIEFAVMDGLIATSGSRGWRAYYEVMDFPTEENLVDSKKYNVTCAHTDKEESSTLIEPTMYTVPA